MSPLLAARSQMAMSLGFHIIFAEIGIAMPVLMVVAEYLAVGEHARSYRALARRWSHGVAILFAVGAVSGTVLSFELGLLWPRFMAFAGAVIGIPFSLEGFAFFAEAIFLGLYLYGRDRMPRWAHLAAGVVVAASGAASAIFVVMVNAWMNAPVGVTVAHGAIIRIDTLAGMRSPAALAQSLHMLLAAYAATGFAVAAIHAAMILRGARVEFHRRALGVALLVGVPAAILQPFAGDLEGRMVARTQPVKLAALEGQFRTVSSAPLRIGGIADEQTATTRDAIEIPGALSLLAYDDVHATVRGLTAFPRSDWPPVQPVHWAFQLMVALGTAMMLTGVWCVWIVARGSELVRHRALLRTIVVMGPFGFLATEAGWVVTEVGRQPWVVQGLLRTGDAVTPMPGLQVPLLLFTLLYAGLAAIVIAAIRAQVQDTGAAA